MPPRPWLANRAALVRAASATGRRWRSYLVAPTALAVLLVATAVVPVVGLDERYAGALLGVVAVLLVVSLVGLESPAQNQSVADAWTLAPLRKARGWAVVDDLPFDRDDVDHVIVAPAAVLAVESRYRPASSADDDRRLQRELYAAERAAAKVRLLMRVEKLRDVAPVVPVLIVWGPGAPQLPDGYEDCNGVHLVDGTRPQQWMRLFNTPRTDAATRRELHERFVQFATRAARSEERVMNSLRAEMWHELKRAIVDERARRAAAHVVRTQRTA